MKRLLFTLAAVSLVWSAPTLAKTKKTTTTTTTTEDSKPAAAEADPNYKPVDTKPVKSAATATQTKSTNLRFSPLGLLIGYINVDLDFPMGQSWTVGPSVSYWRTSASATGFASDISLTAFAIGARANWYNDGVYTDSFYVSPVVQYVSATASSGSTSATASAFSLSAVAGYHWFWDSFNLNLGAGVGSILGGNKVKVTDSTGTVTTEQEIRSGGGLVLDFMMGFVF